MSGIINDLKSLLIKHDMVMLGTVDAIGIDTVIVVSPLGIRTFRVSNPKAYKPGDRVRFQDELFLGKTASEINVPTYTV